MAFDKGSVEIELKEGVYELKFDFMAMRLSEKEYGGSILEALDRMMSGKNPELGTILILLWAGLQHKYRLDMKKVSRLMDMNLDKIAYYSLRIGEALVAAGLYTPIEDGKEPATEDKTEAVDPTPEAGG